MLGTGQFYAHTTDSRDPKTFSKTSKNFMSPDFHHTKSSTFTQGKKKKRRSRKKYYYSPQPLGTNLYSFATSSYKKRGSNSKSRISTKKDLLNLAPYAQVEPRKTLYRQL